jgi:general secretion pathway protein D
MKKIVKIVISLTVLISNSFSDHLKITLEDLIALVVTDKNINVLYDKDINKDLTIFVSSHFDSNLYSSMLDTVLDKNGYRLTKKKNFYYVEKDRYSSVSKRHYTHKLNHISYEDIQKYIDFSKIDTTYLEAQNTLVFNSIPDDYEDLIEVIALLDQPIKQTKLKIVMFEINRDRLKELGTQSGLKLPGIKTGAITSFINILTYPFSITSDDSITNRTFNTTFRFLESSEYVKVITSPIVTISNNKNTTFDVIQQLRFNTSKVTIDNDQQKTFEQSEYKDVGLKVKVKPFFYSEQKIKLDLNIESSNVTSNVDYPLVSKTLLTQNLDLVRNKITFISGLKKQFVSKNTYGFPILKDIPFIKHFFSFTSESTHSSDLVIALEVL